MYDVLLTYLLRYIPIFYRFSNSPIISKLSTTDMFDSDPGNAEGHWCHESSQGKQCNFVIRKPAVIEVK